MQMADAKLKASLRAFACLAARLRLPALSSTLFAGVPVSAASDFARASA